MEYSNRKKKTQREEFLDAMEEIIPWPYWVEMIRPYYFANKRGRKPIGIETMLRMYLMQIWFNLSDEGIDVFCKPFLHKIARSFCRLLHLHFVGNCKTSAGSYSASHKPLQIIFSCYNTRYGNGSSVFLSSCACSLKQRNSSSSCL